MNKYFSIITLLMVSIFLNGCSTERGGSGIVSSGVVSDDVFIADSIKKIDTDGTYTTAAPYASLTAASADIDNQNDKIFTLQGLAVQGSQVTNYTASGSLGWNQEGETSITVATITAPAVSLTFDEDGMMSEVTAYFADKTYKYDIALDESVSASATLIDTKDITSGAQTDATIATLTVDRTEIFGFADNQGNALESNYMAYIGWNFERTQGDPNRLSSLSSDKDTAYSINGSMIAGIETASANIPSNGKVEFIGKGRGFYSHVDKGTASHATIFDVTTDVDFVAKTVDVNSKNTMRCSDKNKASSCTTALNGLNFGTTETFIYIIGDAVGFRGDVSLKANKTFTGTIDARFYGGRAQELGSTFAMRDETGGYYYGAFGGEREGVEASPLLDATIADETITLPNDVIAPLIPIDITTANPYENLTAIAGTDKRVVLNALSVYQDNTTQYIRTLNRDWATDADKVTTTSIVRLAGSAASLVFAGDNQGATLYAKEIYTNDDATIIVDRSTIFGFGSSYMAYISWDDIDNEFDNDNTGLTGEVVDISGKMLAGIETNDMNIPLTGEVSFNGKGRGTYGNVTTSEDTVFDITAEVDFVGKNVTTISSKNTCKAFDGAKCGVGGSDRLDFLNFTSAILSYADTDNATVNHISGAVHADGLAGTVDARFYGGATEEFGGTFALNDSSNYYYGVFGALRGGIAASTIFDNNIVDETVMLPADVTISTGNNLLNNTNDGDIVTLKVLSFYQNDSTDYTRAENRDWGTADERKTTSVVRMLGSAASLSFDGGGNISGVTAYLKDSTHTADPSKVKRGTDFFGFDSNYMAYISWDIDNHFDDDSEGLKARVVDSSGAMLAGIETTNLLDNTAGTVEFKGRGQGAYGDADDDYATIFDVTASVNFVDNNITIYTENTCQADDCTKQPENSLNFNTGAIGFADNSISKRNLNVKGMDGALDARFYGEKTREFGGTFGFASNLSYYYGAFGAERDGVVAPITLTTFNPNGANVSTINTAIAANNPSFNSLTDVVDAGDGNAFTMRALSAYEYDNTTYTRVSNNKEWSSKADKAQSIYIVGLSGAGASLTFGGDGNISGATAYLNGITYTTADLTVDRSTIFGFASHNMAYISWNLQKAESALDNESDYLYDFIFDDAGMMLAGVETAETVYDMDGDVETEGKILTFAAAEFTGKGKGTYGTVTNNVLTGYNTIFDVTASVDFEGRAVTIRSENTCEAVTNPDCTDNGVNRQDFLDLSTSALSFVSAPDIYGDSVAVNSISGDVALDSSNIFKGTLDARFYGYAGREFGGTFSLANASSYYYGAFGAKRETVYKFALDDAKIAAPDRRDAQFTLDAPDVSLHHAINDASATEDREFTMNALVVSANNYTDYARAPGEAWETSNRNKKFSLGRVAGSHISLTIDEDGKLSYMVARELGSGSLTDDGKGDQTLSAVDRNETNTSLDIINISRREEIFGFVMTDMVYIDWNRSNKLLAIGDPETEAFIGGNHGMMIAGIETDYAQMPTANAVVTYSDDDEEDDYDIGNDHYAIAVKFTGKGRGYYANLKTETGFHTIFDVTAHVDFVSEYITIDSGAPLKCTDVNDSSTCSASGLTGFYAIDDIYYNANDISVDIALENDYQFQGTLDARFYGDGAHKFAGTFAMSDSDNTRYYYGAFGAQRETAIEEFNFDKTLAEESGPKSTLDYLTVNQTPHESLHAVAVADGKNGFTTKALAVYQSNHKDYARVPNKAWDDASTDKDHNINLGKLSGAGATIVFDENGNISGFATYLSSNPYIATNIYTITVENPVSNSDVVSQNITDTDTPDDTSTGVMNLYRGESFFGFNSEYMAYIDWRVTRTFADLGDDTIDRSYDYSGAMIAGIETTDTKLSNNSSGIVNFKGRGRGSYYNTNTGIGEQTIFDVTAKLDFGNKNVTINSANTIACADFSNIGTCGISDIGEFSTGIISYRDNLMYSHSAHNNISGAVKANIGAATLTGTLDAHFYGNKGGIGSNEIGGTFTMSNEAYYYYGVFGAEGLYVNVNNIDSTVSTDEEFTQNSTTMTAPIKDNLNINGLTSFNDDARKGKNNNAFKVSTFTTMKANDNQTMDINKFSDAVVSVDFLGGGGYDDGYMGDFRLYFDDKKYDTTMQDSSKRWRNTNYVYVAYPSDIDTHQIMLDRSVGERNFGAAFRPGFTPDYMAKVGFFTPSGYRETIGFGIIGFETAANNMPMASSAVFAGRGRGHYMDNGGQVNTYFDVAVNVDFNMRDIEFFAINTCSDDSFLFCRQGAHSEKHYLDMIANLSYTASNNTISGGITTAGGGLNETLTGTIDASFYGTKGTGYDNAAKEFGGTFLVSNNREAYGGWFGTRRVASIANLATTITTPTLNQHNLTSFDDANGANTTGTALPAMAVQITKQKMGDKTITTDKITTPVVEVSFGNYDEFYTYHVNDESDSGWGRLNAPVFAGFNIYWADKKYSTTGANNNSANHIKHINFYDNSMPTTSAGETPSEIRLSRYNGWAATYDGKGHYFGFLPKYMVRINWMLDENAYEAEGHGIAGFETDGSNIPSVGHIEFKGRGHGRYYSNSSAEYFYFDITANVNFASRYVTLESSNTCNKAYRYNAACSNASARREDFDFNGILSYKAGENKMSGGVTNFVESSKLFGTAEARFYGPEFQEFGGTFAMQNTDAAYVGYFATERITSVIPTSPTPSSNSNHNNLVSFTDDARNDTSGNKFIAIATNITKHSDGTITNGDFTTAAVELAYDADGDFSDASLYLPDRKYSTTASSVGTSDDITDNAPVVADNTHDTPATLLLSRNTDKFTFTPEYMASLYWRVTKDAYETSGYAMTGFKTDGNNFYSHGGVKFSGGGEMSYSSSSSNITSSFSTTANVNFIDYNISLTTDQNDNNNDFLNLTGDLSYNPKVNRLTGTVKTAGNDKNHDALDGTELSGTADARFYGPDLEELGGIFNVSNADASAVGWFGLEKLGETFTNYPEIPTTFNEHNLTSFTDNNRKGTTGNALKVSSVVSLIDGNDIFTDVRSDGSVVVFDYDDGGNFDNFTLYIDDKKYGTSNVNGDDISISDTSPTIYGEHHALREFFLDRQSGAFGFTANYMARVYTLTAYNYYYTNTTYAMTGFETMGNNIPMNGASVNFSGRGELKYHGTNFNTGTAFDVTATVNFETRNINLETDHNDEERRYLDMTGNLSYEPNTNALTGTFTTVGDSSNVEKPSLTGTIEARFYGPAAEEFGGTFSASIPESEIGYIGTFGAKK